jgi:hypothetical protein
MEQSDVLSGTCRGNKLKIWEIWWDLIENLMRTHWELGMNLKAQKTQHTPCLQTSRKPQKKGLGLLGECCTCLLAQHFYSQLCSSPISVSANGRCMNCTVQAKFAARICFVALSCVPYTGLYFLCLVPYYCHCVFCHPCIYPIRVCT